MRKTAIASIVRDKTAASAVEFAMVMPLLLTIMFGIIGFGMVFGTYHGVQELVSQSARASVAGLTDSERASIARTFIRDNIANYPFLDAGALTIATGWAEGGQNAYVVTASYDMSGSVIYDFRAWLPLPDPRVQFSAAIQRGGY